MNELLIGSKEIFDKAVLEYKPKAIVMMFSGGDDSLTAYHVAKEIGIKFDFVIHGNTRTGIEETTLFARKKVEEMGDRYIEADAGSSYVDYVMRKGFFGKGTQAHGFSYNILKNNHFKTVVSKYLRKRQRNFPILFINGARRLESERRKKTMVSPYHFTKAFKNNIWVNIINEWDKPDCKDYLEGNSICRNAVSVSLCRSGECMCGTMQTKGDRIEAAYFYPEWGKNLDELERAVIAKHGFGWNDNKPKPSKFIQTDLFQPMCVGCTKDIIEEPNL
jgi:3'-phosphoadenosine 5'-phosphosulfate sulfotransferase (PAPS reductase)/FAD synthetase